MAKKRVRAKANPNLWTNFKWHFDWFDFRCHHHCNFIVVFEQAKNVIEPPKASEPTKTEIMVPNQAELPHTDPTPTASETGTLGTENTGAASELVEHEESETEKPVIVRPPQNKHETDPKPKRVRRNHNDSSCG